MEGALERFRRRIGLDRGLVFAFPRPDDKIFAPKYAETVLKYGKRTYIDKTFAPDFKTAEQIFQLAERYGAKFFSSSALRYSSAMDGLCGSKYVTTFGGGSTFDEYVVHQAEMVIAATKAEPLSVKVEKQGKQYISTVKLSGGKEATMVYSPSLT